jgi:hypothetical protein
MVRRSFDREESPMIPETTRERLVAAMEQFDREFRGNDNWSVWEDNTKYRYAISHNGQIYPVKKIISLATGAPVGSFHGGDEANTFVGKYGFGVETLRRGDIALIDLAGIADILERRSLDESALRKDADWRREILPVTRPLLEAIASAVSGEANFFAGGDIAKKRTSFDKVLFLPKPLRPYVTVGRVDVRDGELERSLSWGLQVWGRVDRAEAYRAEFEALGLEGFSLRVIPNAQTDTFGGSTVVLYRALDAAGLREREAGELVEEIAEDLRNIKSRIEAREEEPRLLLVAAIKQTEEAIQGVEALAGRVKRDGKGAWWWSYGLNAEHQAVLGESPYLYLYAGVPGQQLTHRIRVADYATTPNAKGMASPWPEFTPEDEVGKTQAGDQKSFVFRTWFLVDAVETLFPPIRLSELVSKDGGPAIPQSMLNAFAIWRRRSEAPPPTAAPNSFDELSKCTFTSVGELEELESLLLEKKQVILEGPPGSGKTFVAEKFARYFTENPLTGTSDERVEIVQFHQSYGYEDFMQGIRPETNDQGQLGYHVRPGIFMRLCDLATRNLDKRFVIVIDEINRGNISRIFGELLFLLEYRDKSVRLPYAKADDPEFSIPENVYIIGTMNTTDRSLAQIDYALRRRFYFYRLRPVVDGRAPVLEGWLNEAGVTKLDRDRLLRLFIRLNAKVTEQLDEHHQVGHSYFMQAEIQKETTLRRVWGRAIMPLVEEYFYNRREREELLSSFSIESLLMAADPEPSEADAVGEEDGE